MKLFISNNRGGNGGFIKWIIIVIIALFILSYFGFNIRDTVESPTTQNNFSYIWNAIRYLWENFLERPASYLWNDVFIDLIWEPLIDNLKAMKVGQDTDIDRLSELGGESLINR